MSHDLPPSAARVKEALDSLNLTTTVRIMPDATRTSQQAADAVDCLLGQIAKSLIFKGKTSGEPILVIASGANRVDLKKIKALVGEGLGKADADYVRQHTGYAIGGIPPVGHDKAIRTLLDKDLWQYGLIWAAAGTPHALFQLTPDDLARITGGEVAEVRED